MCSAVAAASRRDARRAKGITVAVVTDWGRCSRGEFWTELLGEIQDVVANEVRVFRLADLILRRGHGSGEVLVAALSDIDVLVVNWDVVNGDPDFGAHLAQAWFEHHASQIHLWVSTGKKLIIEGQATLSVPDQRAYDALLGPGEVLVCGPQVKGNPMIQRAEKVCVQAEARHTRDLSWMEVLKPDETKPRTYEQMFPGHASLRLTNEWTRGADFNVMCRGWFRRRFRKTMFTWVPLYTTNHKHRYPTMLAARHGNGAIFATTMYLASTRQKALVQDLLRVDPKSLPEKKNPWAPVRSFVAQRVVPVVLAFWAALNVREPSLRKAAETAAWIVLALVIALFSRIRARLARWWREYTGK